MSTITIGEQLESKQAELDLTKNGTGAIIGGSGSGKTWFATTWVTRLLESGAVVEVVDLKNSAYWKYFAGVKWFTHHGGKLESYYDVLNDTLKEVKQRKENEIKEPRKYIILDEYTALTRHLEEDGQKEKVNSLLRELLRKSQEVGVYIVILGQRPVAESILGDSLKENAFKIGLKMEVETDYEILFGDNAQNVARKPEVQGEALVQIGSGEVNLVKLKSDRLNVTAELK